MKILFATSLATVTLPLLAVLCASIGADVQQGAIALEGAWARRAPAMGAGGHGGTGHGAMTANGAVYVTLRNDGPMADTVVSAASDAAHTVELHETRNEGGVMMMRPVARLQVPAGGRLEMKPGGHHVMLLGLKHDLNPGETVTVTLTFEKAGALTVRAPVK